MKKIFCANFVLLGVISGQKMTHNVGIPAGVSPKMPDDVIVARLRKRRLRMGPTDMCLEFSNWLGRLQLTIYCKF
jgi:hypothetical protein